ncbi:hypothetical protein MVI01_05740 [Myxococcus virescens]|uniref:Uncharacterized protein n=1 Tax=Myxococcus virescens TaxID=83456 RepID=A0A511H5I8_9BACT|nr:hypothetical protein MVI01_05740 [Myxococcus virescens]
MHDGAHARPVDEELLAGAGLQASFTDLQSGQWDARQHGPAFLPGSPWAARLIPFLRSALWRDTAVPAFIRWTGAGAQQRGQDAAGHEQPARCHGDRAPRKD